MQAIQKRGIVMIIGFFIIGVITYYTYNDEPPIRGAVTDSNGTSLYTRSDIMAGQQIFLGNGLIQDGPIFGHGAYLGPDFTTECLHRAALSSIDYYGGPRSDTARCRTINDIKTNRYNPVTDTLIIAQRNSRTTEHWGISGPERSAATTSRDGLVRTHVTQEKLSCLLSRPKTV